MPRPSQLQMFLNRCPQQLQEELTIRILKAKTSREAYRHLQSIGFRGSYDSVVNWRNTRNESHQSLLNQSSGVTSSVIEARAGDDIEALRRCVVLTGKLNSLSNQLTDLLLQHRWVDADSTTLNNRDATKLLAILPSLSRAGVGGTVELSARLYGLEEHDIMLAILEEVDEEARRVYESDMLQVVTNITDVIRTRLDVNKSSFMQMASRSES
jgi:hypothetical protein